MEIGKKILFLILVSFLTACGGGSDEEKTTTPPPAANVAPTVNAGEDQNVEEQTSVTISSSASDSDGTISGYSWAQINGEAVTLTGSETSSLAFTAPTTTVALSLVFEVTVTDDDNATSTDQVTVNVTAVNVDPTVNAGEDQNVDEGTEVALAGSATDSDGTINSYKWTQTAGSTVTLTNAESASATFILPDLNSDETLSFELKVTDDEGATNTDQIDVLVKNTRSLFKAILGPLDGAEIKIFSLTDRKTALVETTSTSDGGFEILHQQFEDDQFYLLTASGGMDTDADDDGVIDASPTNNLGTVNALITGAQLKMSGGNITAVSDIAWRFLQSHVDSFSTSDLIFRLNDIASVLIASDLNADGVVDFNDLFYFFPQDQQSTDSLAFNYAMLHQKDDKDLSVITSYHENNVELLLAKLEEYFGNRLSLYTSKDSRSTTVKIEVVPFGNGEVSSDVGNIIYDSSLTTSLVNLSDFFTKSEEFVTLSATPKSDSIILNWDGCYIVSSDLTQCQVKLNSDKSVAVSFGYKETQVVDNFVDLSRANVTFEGETALFVVIEHNDTDLKTKVGELVAGAYVVGATNGGFLRKVTAVTKISDYKYNLETEEATLDEVISQGTGSFSKVMTNGDLDDNFVVEQNVAQSSLAKARQSEGSIPSTPLESNNAQSIPFSKVQGVKLIKSSNPNDTEFTIIIGDESVSEGIGGSLDGTAVFTDDNGHEVRVKGELKLNIKLDFGASYGLFSGLEYMKLVPEINATEKLEVFLGNELEMKEKDLKIGTLPFSPIVFFIGPVPVYLTPKVDLYIGIGGKVTAKLTTGVTLNQQIRAGVVYNKNAGTSYIAEFNPSWDFIEPNAELSGEITPFIEPRLQVLLYSFTGPQIPVRGYTKIKATLINANVGDNIWKHELCVGGVDFTAWLGIQSELKWNLLEGETEGRSILGGMVLEKLNRGAQLFKKEWKLKNWNYAGECNGSLPPYLKLVGRNVFDAVAAMSNENISQEYTIQNTGKSDLNWNIEFIEDSVTSVSKKSGKLLPGTSEVVTVTVNPSSLSVGKYSNELKFVNQYQAGILSDADTGTSKRSVDVHLYPSTISAPLNFQAELFAPTIVELTWDYSQAEQYRNLVKGYQIYQTLTPENADSWESIAVVTGRSSGSYKVSSLKTDETYFFKIDAYTDDVRSTTVETSIEVPEIEPEGDCRAHFSGVLMDDGTGTSGWFSEIYVIDQYSEYVGVGEYPINRQAFPKAVNTTFDGIAIDAGTKVTIYSGENFTGSILYEKVGPAVVNNYIWQDRSEAANAMATWSEPLQSNYPQSVREWSGSNMHDWSFGSLVVECGY